MEEASKPKEALEEPSSAVNETEDTAVLNGSHSPTDETTLAENDLLGFSMPPSTEVVSNDGTEDLLGFSTPQETLASSTDDLLDFASAPTSMTNTPSPEQATEDLLGFASTAPVEETVQTENAVPAEATGAELSQPDGSYAGNPLVDIMSATPRDPGETQNGLESTGSDPVVKSNAAETAPSRPDASLLDVFSSEQPAASTPATIPSAEEAPADPSGNNDSDPSQPEVSLVAFASEQPAVTESEPVNAMEKVPEKDDTPELPAEETTPLATADQASAPAPSQPEALSDVLAPKQPVTDSAHATVPVDDTPKAPIKESVAAETMLKTETFTDTDTGTVEVSQDLIPSTESESNQITPTAVGQSNETAADESTLDNQGEPDLQRDSAEETSGNDVPEQEPEAPMEEVKAYGAVETAANDALHEAENEGMAEVALDAVEVKSPVVAASSEPSVLSDSVAKKVQQVDPWQTGAAVNNESDPKESTAPLNDETKAEPPAETTSPDQSVPSPTMVDIPLPDEQQSSTTDNTSAAEKDALLVELQSALQDHMTRQAEAEDRARIAEARMKQLEQELQAKEKAEADLEALKERMKSVVSDKANLELELAKLRTSRDEHERKEIVLSNRLNAAKKKEALKADLAERLEEEIKGLQAELSATKDKLTESEGSGQKAEKTLEQTTQQMTERVRLAETALADERRLNEDRKRKMKAFIESKQEEVRQGKVQTDELNAELEQTNRLLREQNSRWKQLHAQWVQSQTRNRELQRDLNRIKKDSDNMHKIGDKMEMKLSKSAQETEEHKNKRLTAKHELMTILRTLEGEREVSSKLRDSLKFTFTPKALSQQQLLKESLKDFESELEKLSRRLGRPLPPSIDSPTLFSDDDETEGTTAASNDDHRGENDREGEEVKDGTLNRSELDSNHLIANLETETQHVSQCIMALTSSIERMHVVLDESGPSTCINALTTILMGGAPAQRGSAAQDERASMTGGTMRSTRYGQVPTS